MKIIVTGALGHIGSYVIRDLAVQFLGVEIVMIDNMLTQRYPSLFSLPEKGNYHFIEGDGTGPDIWNASKMVLDAAIKKAYKGEKQVAWLEVYAGDKSNAIYGENTWLPQETLDLINELRSLSQGTASFESNFERLQEFSGKEADDVITKRSEAR